MTKVISSREIAHQLSSLSFHLNGLELEATELALAAVSGDADAAKRLAEIRKEIERAKGDRDILESAKVAAVAKEAEAEYGAEAADRAAALNEARAHAGELLALSEEADRAIAAFIDVTKRMDAVERNVWAAIRRSGTTPPGSILGRNGIAEEALSRMEVKVRGLRVSDKRGVRDLVSTAWDFLNEIDETEAA